MDPTGHGELVDLIAANRAQLTLAGIILVIVGIALYKLRGVFGLSAAKSNSPLVTDSAVLGHAAAYLIQYDPNNKYVIKFRQAVQTNLVNLYSMPAKLYHSAGEWTTTQGTNDLYVGDDILNSKDEAAIALSIFGEYQHSSSGGNQPDTMAVEAELESVRRTFPKADRSALVNAIHHGSLPNHQ